MTDEKALGLLLNMALSSMALESLVDQANHALHATTRQRDMPICELLTAPGLVTRPLLIDCVPYF